MLTFHATEQINEVSRTTTQVITRYFGRWPQTKIAYLRSMADNLYSKQRCSFNIQTFNVRNLLEVTYQNQKKM